MKRRDNAFDLIRHFAALLVLFSHHYALSGRPEPHFPRWDTLGFVAVAIFFTISGYFMPASFNSSRNVVEFVGRRCRRIFPGLIVCSFLMTYVVGTIFTSLPRAAYLRSAWAFSTFVRTSALLGRAIPGVFAHFTFRGALNGSLWTLPVEFACYLIFALTMSVSNTTRTVLGLLLVAALSTERWVATGFAFSFYDVPSNYLSVFGLAFATGSLLARTQQLWRPVRWLLALVSVVMLGILGGRPEMEVLGTMGLACLTVVIGTSFRDRLIGGRFDISYGIYIYAFPIQQLVINLVTRRFWTGMALSTAATLLAGYLSFRLVERPFLRRRFSPVAPPPVAEPTPAG